LYVEDLKRGTNKDIGTKDIFEMGSKHFGRIGRVDQMESVGGCQNFDRLNCRMFA
jgi:hypothetical protein